MTKPAITAPTAPATVDLFPSYEAAVAASRELEPWAAQILGVPSIVGAEQEAWAATVGSAIQTKLKAEVAAQAAELKPVRDLEATIRGYRKPNIDTLERCKAHLASLLSAARAAAAAAQAAALPQATTGAERDRALAVLAPKPAGWVERESWEWDLAPDALPLAEMRADGTVALVFSARSLPPDYFVLDADRISREVKSGKAETRISGVVPRREVAGHFRGAK